MPLGRVGNRVDVLRRVHQVHVTEVDLEARGRHGLAEGIDHAVPRRQELPRPDERAAAREVDLVVQVAVDPEVALRRVLALLGQSAVDDPWFRRGGRRRCEAEGQERRGGEQEPAAGHCRWCSQGKVANLNPCIRPPREG